MTDYLIARVQPREDYWEASWVSSSTGGRTPAARAFRSEEAARQWVEDEAALLRVPVRWHS